MLNGLKSPLATLDVLAAPEPMPVMLYCWKGIGGTASNACIGSNRKGLRCSVTLALGVLKSPKISSIFGFVVGTGASKSSIEEVLGPKGAGSFAKGSKNVDGTAVTVDFKGYDTVSNGSGTFAAGVITVRLPNPL